MAMTISEKLNCNVGGSPHKHQFGRLTDSLANFDF